MLRFWSLEAPAIPKRFSRMDSTLPERTYDDRSRPGGRAADFRKPCAGLRGFIGFPSEALHNGTKSRLDGTRNPDKNRRNHGHTCEDARTDIEERLAVQDLHLPGGRH